ncbi:DUF3558 family protein [Actinoplanes sp. RD1]|uniref:DUF3558 family protein n=1 Tax=Actinoplanes sp. RD1 TaxID=3064538 RepID=UPI0027424C97|nr:DUF3558 family protein [Actinoplanes sp. RD1]
MHHRRVSLAALFLIVALAGGCGVLTPAAGGTGPAPASTAADSGLGPAGEPGDLPDPCTLLTEAQVTGLTGREITQVDEDDAAGEPTRYCQWQQSGGQLDIFLTRTTPAGFDAAVAEGEPVDGVGEEASWLSGHLFVLGGTVQLDVYSRGASDARNLADAKQVAAAVLPALGK